MDDGDVICGYSDYDDDLYFDRSSIFSMNDEDFRFDEEDDKSDEYGIYINKYFENEGIFSDVDYMDVVLYFEGSVFSDEFELCLNCF